MKAGRPAVILKQVLETKPLTLFIVDDEHGIRQLLVRILSHAGYHVVENRSAREALNNLKNVTPALIVSDVVMPDMDGFELCNQIRKNPDTEWIPFLFLTAKSEETDRLKGFETGADAYLLKPFSNRELLIRISNLLMRIRQFYRILETPPADLIDIPEGPGMLTGDRPDEIMSLKTLETMDQGFIGEMRVRLLIDLLQFISTYPDTFMVSLINEHKEKAALILDNGAVIHALCGDRTGENALEHIMLWEKGIYRVIRLSRRPPRTMEKHIEQLAFKHYIVRGNLPDQPAKIENEPGDSRFVSDEVHGKLKELTGVHHRLILIPCVLLNESPLSSWLRKHAEEGNRSSLLKKHFSDIELPSVIDIASLKTPPVLAPIFEIGEFLSQEYAVMDNLSEFTLFIGASFTEDTFDYFVYVLGQIEDTLRTIPLIAVSEQNAVGVVSGRDFFNAPDMGSFRKKIKMVDGIPAEEQLKQILAEVPQTVRGLEQ